jgi:hypothetical protein
MTCVVDLLVNDSRLLETKGAVLLLKVTLADGLFLEGS